MGHTSIREQVKRAILVTSVVTTVVVLFVMGLEQLNRMDRMMREKADFLAHLVQTSLPGPVWNLNETSMGDILDAIFSDTDVVYLAVIEDGEFLARRVRDAFQGEDFATIKQQPSILARSVDILYEGEVIATADIAISNKSFATSIYKDIGYLFALTLLLIVSLTLRIFSAMHASVFVPLEKLEDSASLISQGNLDEPIANLGKDEIGRLGMAFEIMRQSLQRSMQELNAANEDLEENVRLRTRELEEANRRIQSSIDYASLIQGAVMPEDSALQRYFQDHFALWSPKDVVGGDIYLFSDLGNDEECLLMVIDCTGHNVAGAFVTMLVKALERQVVESIIHGDMPASPAEILRFFNRNMKHLLKQYDANSVSDAGFDGAVIYYHRQNRTIRFSGARTPLFYMEDGACKMIKGSRHSVGYRRSNPDFVFDEHLLPVTAGMRLYISTDGYPDQTGGEKGFCLGTGRFRRHIENIQHAPLKTHREMLWSALLEYQGDHERNDDITVIGLEI